MLRDSCEGRLIAVLVICTLVSAATDENGRHQCFCKLQGEVDDCSCTVENVDSFNNLKVYPRVENLLQKNYFRFFKVNLHRRCPFWPDDSRCALRDCAVESCKEEEVPQGLKVNHSDLKNKINKYSEEAQKPDGCVNESVNGDLGHLDTTISEQDKKAFETWRKYDDAQDKFCEMDDEDSSELEYVDLLLNPERYTGYKGDSPHRVWHSIYNENCFHLQGSRWTWPEKLDYNSFLKSQAYTGMCLEKRAFYRLISGLHSSINIHLSSKFLFPGTAFTKSKWGPNLDEFRRRFDPETTNGQGPQWLKNLYFTYLVELRALAKIKPFLKRELFYTGNESEDREVKEAVDDLLEVARSFPEPFDESMLFRGDPKQAAELKNAFRSHFLNISKIMDCVGCDKCKLWGKLQTQGMGTALKILFSGKTIGPESTLESSDNFKLSRTEIVTLLNAFGRLSTSIKEVEWFREKLK